MLRELRDQGATDYLLVPFRTGKAYEQPWIAFATDIESGFSEAHLALLNELCRPLAWKARAAMAEWSTRSLLEVYLGSQAAERVLSGQFRRGTGTVQRAVIWFCDLRGFTNLGSRVPASMLVAVLDQYFDRVASAIKAQNGEILKLIGDAVLAIFPCDDDDHSAARSAVQAARGALDAVEAWNLERNEAGDAPLAIGIGLHIGDVMYGNIGSQSRLDFTVIGSAVNEASRLESLCKELAVPVVVSESFASAAGKSGMRSCGTVHLRGLEGEQTVFTLEEGPDPA
jgi:adenylate cyclase